MTQAELPTLERPVIEEIERVCEQHQAAKTKAAAANLELSGVKATADHTLSENFELLEKDGDGHGVYVYQGGDEPIEYVIPCRGPMRTRKPTKIKTDGSDEPSNDNDEEAEIG